MRRLDRSLRDIDRTLDQALASGGVGDTQRHLGLPSGAVRSRSTWPGPRSRGPAPCPAVRSRHGARSLRGRSSSAATREKPAPPGITSCAQGASPGLVGTPQRYSVFARFASTPSAAQTPSRRPAPGESSKPVAPYPPGLLVTPAAHRTVGAKEMRYGCPDWRMWQAGTEVRRSRWPKRP